MSPDDPPDNPAPARPDAATAAWDRLRRHTPARIGLPRTGPSVATPAHLGFQLAHARARDAVHDPLDSARLAAGIESLVAGRGLAVRSAESQAGDRRTYLMRPDLGRRLTDASEAALRAARPPDGADAVLVVADGLSARAVHDHGPALLGALLDRLDRAEPPWRLAPVVLVEQGRVAIGDAIGAALGADLAVVLIGERPGLSSPDSLGVYLTWQPRPGRTDAERNCLSNIRPQGLPPVQAADRLAWLMTEARRRRLSGVALKDGSDVSLLDDGG
jgi:ethanolamine ammonia-lyase small subunit